MDHLTAGRMQFGLEFQRISARKTKRVIFHQFNSVHERDLDRQNFHSVAWCLVVDKIHISELVANVQGAPKK